MHWRDASVLTSIEVIECYRLFSIFWSMGGEVEEGLEGVRVQVGWGDTSVLTSVGVIGRF